MKRLSGLGTAAALALCFFPTKALCSGAPEVRPAVASHTLAGDVLSSQDGTPVGKIRVKLVDSKDAGKTWTTTSDQMGLFRFIDVPPGDYRLMLQLKKGKWTRVRASAPFRLDAPQVRQVVVHASRADQVAWMLDGPARAVTASKTLGAPRVAVSTEASAVE